MNYALKGSGEGIEGLRIHLTMPMPVCEAFLARENLWGGKVVNGQYRNLFLALGELAQLLSTQTLS